ncbi:MAG: 8-amino-7-oxononanoate synthase [Gemmatimonadota bacterium]|nr:8-amino-7-oxononanoate synthase [Gemmatimonadota bacterium]
MTLPPDRFKGFRVGLEGRAEAARLRRVERYVPEPGTPFVVHEGRRLLSFCSNDYLGLATDPGVVAAAVRVTESHGTGSGASRLVVGSFDIHDDLERELAAHTGRPAALLFNAGFQANASIIPAVTSEDGFVVCDSKAHASILQGCRLSRATFERFPHNDIEQLDSLLAAHGEGPTLVVTESLFSMDGDRAPLAEICEVADRHGALLMVDDAHATGVFGDRGEGLAAAYPRIDLLLGTFGKAFGSAGAFVASSELLRSQLVNFCSGVVFSTAPAPPAVGAARAALEAIRSGTIDHECFHGFVARAHERLREAGFDTSPSDSQIIPIRLGDDRAALACESFLRSRGILAIAIRPPTVPEGTARLRISLTHRHTGQHLEDLVEALRDYRGVS